MWRKSKGPQHNNGIIHLAIGTLYLYVFCSTTQVFVEQASVIQCSYRLHGVTLAGSANIHVVEQKNAN